MVDYKGVPMEALRIDEVIWTPERAHHIRTRSQRRAGDFDVQPEWATEGALDPHRVVRIAGNEPATESLKVIGRSTAAAGALGEEQLLLKVWIWSDDPEGSSTWNGGSAAKASSSDVAQYEEAR